jgi:hypothetical protein
MTCTDKEMEWGVVADAQKNTITYIWPPKFGSRGRSIISQ